SKERTRDNHMQESQSHQEIPLQQLAAYAAYNSIKGSSFKRNALLKPLDIILDELNKCLHPDDPREVETLRAGTKELVFHHMELIAGGKYTPGRTKQSKVNHFVDLFFDGVLGQTHHGKINALLTREKLLRAAYLFWVREAWAEIYVARGQAQDLSQATDALQQLEEEAEDVGLDENTTREEAEQIQEEQK